MADSRASGVSIACDPSAQESFAARHPWFQVERPVADTHFPVIEVPDAITVAIDRLVG